MTLEAEITRRGTAGIGITDNDFRSAYVVLPIVPEEDYLTGKQETTVIESGIREIKADDHGVFSGGLKQVPVPEDPILGLIREIELEYGVVVPTESVQNHLPTAQVTQVRKGKIVTFDITNHTVLLGDDVVEKLGPNTLKIPIMELLHMLDQGLIPLRPAARLLLYSALNYWMKEGLL